MSVVSILPARVEREKSWAVGIGLAAALAPNALGQYHLAQAVGWNDFLSAALPIASELFATMAARVWAATPKRHKEARQAAAMTMGAGIALSFGLNGLAEAVAFGAVDVALWTALVVALVPTLCVAALLHMAMGGQVEEVTPEAVEPVPVAELVAETPAIEPKPKPEPEAPKRSSAQASKANIAAALEFLRGHENPDAVTGPDLAEVIPNKQPRYRRAALSAARELYAAESASQGRAGALQVAA